jgi:hypothetical protein
MIARPGEAEHIDRCFSSWWDAVDELVFVFTGEPEDGTVAAAEVFAEARRRTRTRARAGGGLTSYSMVA